MEAGFPSVSSASLPVALDTHAHVSMEDFDADRQPVIARARSGKVNFVEIGFDAESSFRSLSLARMIGGKCAVGIHPHEAGGSLKELDAAWDRIESLLSGGAPEVVAIGEIGLDYAREFSPRAMQIACFRMGLGIAKERRLPVVIHQREAQSEVLDLVRAAGLAAPVIFHCFGGDAEYARKCLDLGGYVGLGGTLTYPKNQHLRNAVKGFPLDRILLETDAPYLAPQRVRGKRNEPVYVLDTAALVAQLLGLELAELLAATSSNADRAFMSRTAWQSR